MIANCWRIGFPDATHMLFSDSEGNISNTAPKVSMLDHGFLFGDSVYEVVRLYNKKAFGWTDHMDRFVQSGERLGIPVREYLQTIETRAFDLLKALGEADAAMRIFVTRGVGRLHIDPRSCEKPTILMAAWKFDPELFKKPVRLAIAKTRRNSIHATDPSIKSGNYLNSVMAFRESLEWGFDDAMMLNEHGEATELTTSNFGWVAKGIVYTPHTDCGILHGVTRRYLLQCADVTESRSQVKAIEEADEVFAISTFKEILPVTELRLESGFVKTWEPGPVTAALQKKLRETVERKLSEQKPIF